MKNKSVTLAQFEDRTCLLPRVIAEVVLMRHGMGETNTDFPSQVEDKAVRCYNHNPRFRRQMNLNSGRELLYTFTEHWLDSYMKRGHLQ